MSPPEKRHLPCGCVWWLEETGPTMVMVPCKTTCPWWRYTVSVLKSENVPLALIQDPELSDEDFAKWKKFV